MCMLLNSLNIVYALAFTGRRKERRKDGKKPKRRQKEKLKRKKNEKKGLKLMNSGKSEKMF